MYQYGLEMRLRLHSITPTWNKTTHCPSLDYGHGIQPDITSSLEYGHGIQPDITSSLEFEMHAVTDSFKTQHNVLSKLNFSATFVLSQLVFRTY